MGKSHVSCCGWKIIMNCVVDESLDKVCYMILTQILHSLHYFLFLWVKMVVRAQTRIPIRSGMMHVVMNFGNQVLQLGTTIRV